MAKNRDKSGRFAPGNPGGPGRPKRQSRPVRAEDDRYVDDLCRRAEAMVEELARFLARHDG